MLELDDEYLYHGRCIDRYGCIYNIEKSNHRGHRVKLQRGERGQPPQRGQRVVSGHSYSFSKVSNHVHQDKPMLKEKTWDQCVLSIKKMNDNSHNNDNEWMFCIDTVFGKEYNENGITPLKLKSGFEYIICIHYNNCECIRYPIQEKSGVYMSVSCNYT